MNPQQSQVALGAWATVGCTRATAALALTAIVGCSSCPPFRASWYLDEPLPIAPPAAAASGASAVEAVGASSAPTSAKQASAPASAASAIPVIYLALLNEGPKEVNLTKVVVNPQDPKRDWWQRILPSWKARSGHMWIRSSDENGKDNGGPAEEGKLPDGSKTWKPGELLLFKVVDKDFLDKEERACSLPVAVQIQCDDGCAKSQAVSGALPNYLHAAWIKSCQPLKPLKPPK